jgi:hypothetical protein
VSDLRWPLVSVLFASGSVVKQKEMWSVGGIVGHGGFWIIYFQFWGRVVRMTSTRSNICTKTMLFDRFYFIYQLWRRVLVAVRLNGDSVSPTFVLMYGVSIYPVIICTLLWLKRYFSSTFWQNFAALYALWVIMLNVDTQALFLKLFKDIPPSQIALTLPGARCR